MIRFRTIKAKKVFWKEENSSFIKSKESSPSVTSDLSQKSINDLEAYISKFITMNITKSTVPMFLK